MPEGGLGLARRTAAIVGVTWLPVVIGALVAGQVLGGSVADPLLRHFAVHARLLISVPLLIFAEAVMEQRIPHIIRHFVTSGLVDSAMAPRFRATLEAAVRLRDSVWGVLFVLAVMASVILAATTQSIHNDEMAWTTAQAPNGGPGFAGWWYIFVSRPIFAGLLAIWVWRMLVLWILVSRISKLDLHLVASHPDRAGGLGFLENTTVTYAPVILAISVVLAGIWGHQVLYHGVHVDSLKPLALAFVVVMVLVFNGPLLLLGRTLGRYRRRMLLEYSALIGHHDRLVQRKWIDKEEVGTPEILDCPELGPTVDIGSIYEAVARMRVAPISKRSLLPVVVASALPLLPVFAIEVPIKDLLRSLAGALL